MANARDGHVPPPYEGYVQEEEETMNEGLMEIWGAESMDAVEARKATAAQKLSKLPRIFALSACPDEGVPSREFQGWGCLVLIGC